LVHTRGLRGAPLLFLFAGGLALAWLVNASLASGKNAAAGASVTTVTVTMGKPSEFGFKLSKSQVPIGVTVFKVTNAGKLPHDFKVCTRATGSTTANACVGSATPLVLPGKSAVLKVTFTKKGSFEYLCTVAGHAKAGMKGLLGAGQKPSTTGGTTGKTTTTTTTTTSTTPIVKPPATETLGGDPASGATVFATAGCASCHTLAAAHATGTAGLNLDRLAPGQALIVTTVTNGAFNMPAFGGQLTAQQINDVAAFVYQSTHQ
jgi:uncharacterized cupredoxin-like copper-binding protein/mono/diheme cytochrome c family protein